MMSEFRLTQNAGEIFVRGSQAVVGEGTTESALQGRQFRHVSLAGADQSAHDVDAP